MPFEVTRGTANPLGVTLDASGANVAVFSSGAERIDLCLFDDDDRQIDRIVLPFRTGDIHHAHVAGLRAGMKYGLRVTGPDDTPRGAYYNDVKVLIDPYARLIDRPIRWHQSMSATGNTVFGSRMYGGLDTARAVPKGIMTEREAFNWDGDVKVAIDPTERIIYEAHVKGLTMMRDDVPEQLRGTYAGLANAAMIEHFKRLGVTTIELLPVFGFIDDEFLLRRGLKNYWGYQPITYFAPEPRYAAGGPLAAADELRGAVKLLHQAGLEVILDVVYNHTGEGGPEGPILSFRGLDNSAYYQLTDGGHVYVNDAGTGNTVNVLHPQVSRLILDSLRYWITEYHVDGFRFDLAAILGRTPEGFNAYNALLQAMTQDPVIGRSVLIAEPWDLGPGGYQLGAFPQPFAEWNDKFRDAVRLGWGEDDLACVHIASRVLGSGDRFDRHFRAPYDSINFVTAHDGMTLRDVVSYANKHNDANREQNADGHDENFSHNFGVEGPTDDPGILEARWRRARAMLATLFFSQGTPMMLAGDEAGNSQMGNNNTYSQDNALGWVQWESDDPVLEPMVAEAIALRKTNVLLRQPAFLHGSMRVRDGMPDVEWYRPDGKVPEDDDWHNPLWKALQLVVRGAGSDPATQSIGEALLIVFVLDDRERDVVLPAWQQTEPDTARRWQLVFDSNEPGRAHDIFDGTFTCSGQAVYAFTAVVA